MFSNSSITNALRAEFHRFEDRQHEGKPARVMVAKRIYDTDVDDLWDALTDRERIPRWFLPIEGDLKLGGRYQFQGNAGGTITRCNPPAALDVTWECNGSLAWVNVRLVPDGKRTALTLEHIIPVSDADEHWTQFGPGAVGVGWDLGLLGMARYLEGGGKAVDREAAAAWVGSDDGKAFIRASAEAWRAAHVAGGEDETIARGMAERTAAAYTGG
jgi:uncharacterized protein YndB with AHSA1/START domain